jgi:ABC-type glycerol-3-phosphate transport system substrate-binding protein
MPNIVPANTEGLPAINRRRLLGGIGAVSSAAAVAGASAATAAAYQPTEPGLTPDERIEAAVNEIIAAFREKYPNCPIRVRDFDNLNKGMVCVITHIASDPPDSLIYERAGLARRVRS